MRHDDPFRVLDARGPEPDLDDDGEVERVVSREIPESHRRPPGAGLDRHDLAHRYLAATAAAAAFACAVGATVRRAARGLAAATAAATSVRATRVAANAGPASATGTGALCAPTTTSCHDTLFFPG